MRDVFDDMDAKIERHQRRMAAARAGARKLGGRSVKADEFGWWKCSFDPTRGDRTVRHVRGRTVGEMLRNLRALAASIPYKRPPKKAKAAQ